MTPFIEMGKPVRGSYFGKSEGGKDQDVHLGHVISNISIGCQSGDV